MKVVIVGAGIAGSILAYALHHTSGVDVRILERAPEGGGSDSMTGLNIGPNAIKALAAHVPDLHDAVLGVSVLWRSWRVSLADGTPLMSLPLSQVADHPGIRVRWAHLHRALRATVAGRTSFDSRVVAAGYSGSRPGKLFIEARRGEERIGWDDVDLLVGADGRYSELRKSFCGLPSIVAHDVALFQLLVPDSCGGLIEDYEQWFNGPNRLLAFRLPDGDIYIAGSFPYPAGRPLAELYTPRDAPPCPACRWILDMLDQHARQLRWSRLEEVPPLYSDERGQVLLLGEAAHGMVPTLGQGATQAIEDACLAAATVRAHWLGARRAKVPVDVPALVRAIAERRTERIRFVMDLSREASVTMLPGAEKLRRLYCEAPVVI